MCSAAGQQYTVHYYTAVTVNSQTQSRIYAASRQSHVSAWPTPFDVSILTHFENDEARNDNSNNLQWRKQHQNT